MKKLTLFTAVLFYSGGALAHTGVAEGGGWLAGLAHPLSGADHLLAALAVGIWAARQGGRRVWSLPLVFVLSMALSIGLVGLGLRLPGVEPMIALSLLALGAVLLWERRLPLPFAGGLLGLFALFHGHAHGLEMPPGVVPAAYIGGLLLSSALLHLGGVTLGLVGRQGAARLGGACLGAAGLLLLAGA